MIPINKLNPPRRSIALGQYPLHNVRLVCENPTGKSGMQQNTLVFEMENGSELHIPLPIGTAVVDVSPTRVLTNSRSA